jgi:hypothetical protein
LDFGFWILDWTGLRYARPDVKREMGERSDAQSNPKSKFQNPKSPSPNLA